MKKTLNERTQENINSPNGIIEPTEHGLLCGTCSSPIDRDIAKPDALLAAERTTVCPHFCSVCDTWFHPKCLPESSTRDGKLHCPKCGEKAALQSPTFYCQSCSKVASVRSGTIWPYFVCMACGKPTSLAVTTDVIGAEAGWLIGIGVLSLAAFIGALAGGLPRPLVIVAGSIAGIFALPWIFLVLAAIVKGLMPMGMDIGSIGNWGGGVDNILLHQAREFRARPRWYRFLRVYLWVAVNGLFAAIILALGLLVIHFFTQQASNVRH